jgi:hypothetical protein
MALSKSKVISLIPEVGNESPALCIWGGYEARYPTGMSVQSSIMLEVYLIVSCFSSL